MINTRALEGRTLPSLLAEALRRALWGHTVCDLKPNAMKQHKDSLILGMRIRENETPTISAKYNDTLKR
jgi:hypothetical protein